MELAEYAAFSGLERVAIVAAAVVIGYWGYRLYVGEKNAGLVFMALACVVLLGVLFTGTSHVRSVSEGYQLASARPQETDLPAPAVDSLKAVDALKAVDSLKAVGPRNAEPTVVPATAAAPGAEPSPFREPASAADGATSEPADAEPVVAALGSAAAPEAPQRLATGQELGGRIVAVKSENVSLEWSSN